LPGEAPEAAAVTVSTATVRRFGSLRAGSSWRKYPATSGSGLATQRVVISDGLLTGGSHVTGMVDMPQRF